MASPPAGIKEATGDKEEAIFANEVFFDKRDQSLYIPAYLAVVVKSLRNMKDDNGMIKELLDEAENERMHLMTFIEIAKPSKIERFLILLAQISFGIFYTLLYIFFKKTAHRMIGYFEEEAVLSLSLIHI